MNIEDIFKQRKQNWASLINIRRNRIHVQYTCPSCDAQAESDALRKTRWICRQCGYYHMMPSWDRIEMLCDKDSFQERFTSVQTGNPLSFPQYEEVLDRNREKAGLSEAFVAGTARIGSIELALGVLDGRFLMGSMGTAVGEKICQLTEYAGRKKLPLLIVSASGGARMQEGLFSLMQMANTGAAVQRFKDEGGLFISLLTNPTAGGVSASYASLGDIILAEPGALICFAGPRVIRDTIGQTLPEGFQHAEFLLEHGMIDCIVERRQMRSVLKKLLYMHRKER